MCARKTLVEFPLRVQSPARRRRGSLAALPRRDTHTGTKTCPRHVFLAALVPFRASARCVSQKTGPPNGWSCFCDTLRAEARKGTSAARKTCRGHVLVPVCVSRRGSAASEPRRLRAGDRTRKGNSTKVFLAHIPFLTVCGNADRKTCGQPKRRPLQRSGLLFWKCTAGRFEPAVRQFRCRRKLPPVWTPSCTMKNAWGSSSCITCCRVPISYLDRHTHSTCTSSPV